ncbi:glycoside hydrolase family 32 protein [Halalkalibacter alkalisediminis]|uniref:Sucrose-6-phosphate hydrolase n=1 Tax=Halalkalibacter alkalisediminis TaxID=935616 RepID=A0ABV6NM34_9BACI|nr:glycoside hydrolase family 32 protein [Halalkalibacter alkalisediminis]
MLSNKQQIEEANREVEKIKKEVEKNHWRLAYHLAPQANWMNDPNGFSFYKGEYHLFYQHHPYSPEWGPMFWGHAKSRDLAHWEHLPIALAPSEDYDVDGCFSGSAIEKDGKLYLMYTGNKWTGENRDTDLKQVQCLAVSEDGLTFEKIKENPVMTETPEGDIHPYHWRDPKVWQEGDYYYCILGSKTKDEKGQVLLYRSNDLISWEFLNVAAKGEGNFGFMWECPDLFRLDDQDVLIMSPQGVHPEGDLYHNLHQSGYILGTLNYETGVLDHGPFELLDYGFDFYAPQTTIDDKGQRVMIAWMAMWENEMPEQEFRWAGATTLPRILTLNNGKMVSEPAPELKALRQNEVSFENIKMDKELQLTGIEGECIELRVTIDAKEASTFGLKVRVNEEENEETLLTYQVEEETLLFDRNRSGKGPGGVRKAAISLRDNRLQLHVFIDHSSIEVFAQGGEKVMTGRIYPSEKANGISFFADQEIVIVSVEKWEMKQAFVEGPTNNVGGMNV